jgi:hypothetical protein
MIAAELQFSKLENYGDATIVARALTSPWRGQAGR